ARATAYFGARRVWLPPSCLWSSSSHSSSAWAAEHRRMSLLDDPSAAQPHVHAAWQTGIETAHRAHDVDSLEILLPVLLEDRHALDCILVGPGSSVHISRTRVPWRWRIGMVVGDPAVLDDEVVRQHAAHRFVEPAAYAFIGDREILEHLYITLVNALHRLFHEEHGHGGGVRDEVGARPITLAG